MIGIPGLEAIHGWLAIPFSSMYTVSLTGNCLILLAVKRTSSLHQPMYYFLSMLALTDAGLTLSTLPTTLPWLCSVLLAMSFDHFVAISNSLRYAVVLTNNVIIGIGLAIVAQATLCLFPVPFLIKRLNFCPGDNTLSHSFCFHPDVMRWACADITINICYGLYVVVSIGGIDSLLIILSYTFILRTVMGLASPREHIRALNACVSHILVVFVFFVPAITMSMMHRFGRHLPHIVHALVAYAYLVIPPVLNPIIYRVKSKPIREAMLRMLRKRGQG
ncbi:hypothetical protein P7K49_022222 [Saguinus oedipus]|uniref:G-protein coupled receptors family 1 profile domain-containing protein n=1 Tax=Saguinus oedipus TaxID=9490 RepID=A0ABQ9UUT6_SAGOE|nr:hypothetical protein P7K49_022222 [Saguinus oedipus]